VVEMCRIGQFYFVVQWGGKTCVDVQRQSWQWRVLDGSTYWQLCSERPWTHHSGLVALR